MEILSLKWSYINFDLGIAKLPDSKTGFKVLQAPVPALAILESMPKVSEFVFPSDSATGHMASLKGAWDALCTFAGLDGWRIHDLRHVFANIMVNSARACRSSAKSWGTHRRTRPSATPTCKKIRPGRLLKKQRRK